MLLLADREIGNQPYRQESRPFVFVLPTTSVPFLSLAQSALGSRHHQTLGDHKNPLLALIARQLLAMLARVCLVLDLEGVELQDQFIVRELGWCDWTGRHSGHVHYHPSVPYPEDWKERRQIRFVRRHIHGLPYYPHGYEKARPAVQLEHDVKRLVEQFQRPDKNVVAYKGGHYEKDLLERWGIPHFNLEQAHCPKFNTMTRLRYASSCGCHDDPFRHHCPQMECYHFVHWMRGQMGLDRDLNFVHTDRVHRFTTCT